jgi:hypothetical protein
MQIHTDQPASIQSEDRFQRYEFAKRMAVIAATANTDKSLIIGLYGKWGEGKTTVMNFIQQELPKDTIIVNFNPWLFSDEQHLLKSFFSTLATSIGTEIKSGKEKVGEILADYGDAIGDFTEHIPKVGSKFRWLGKLGKKLSSVSVEVLKSRVDTMIRKSGKPIVIFVDDIDRLDVNEIQYVFKLVKLVGDFPCTSYILSFDDEMVSAALAPKYGGDSKTAGYNFLEKIIQVPLKIPKASKKTLSKYTITLLNQVLESWSIQLSKDESSGFVEAFNSAFLPFMDNPRMGIRYANSLSFSLPLLKGETNTGNLMIIEGIKIFYPELYDFIRAHGYLFLERTDSSYSDYGAKQQKQDDNKKRISSAIQIYNNDRQKVIVELLEQLFPQLKAIYSNTTYPDTSYTQWTKEKKICSGRYFERYFSYTVQEGDIPDNYFERLIADLEAAPIEETVRKLEQTIEQYAAFDLILKLRMHEKMLNEGQSTNLSFALAQIGHSFPLEQDMHFATTYAQSANLIARLVRNISKTRQVDLIIKLLSEAQSLEYAMEINYWLMYREKNYPDKAIFSENDESRIQEFIVERFQKEMTDENFFSLVTDGNLWRILSWWSKSDKCKEALRAFGGKHLGDKNNPDFALKLLKVFTPTINATSFGPRDKHSEMSTYKSGFYKANYEAIKEVVDVNLINDNLIAKYGNHPHETGPSVISDRDPINDKTLVSVFQWFIKNDLDIKQQDE